MLAYAANRPATAASRPSPNAMLAVIVAHITVVAAVMSVKMEMPPSVRQPPIQVDLIDDDPPPPPQPVEHHSPRPQAGPTALDPPVAMPTPSPDPVPFPLDPAASDPNPVHEALLPPLPTPKPVPHGVTAGPRLSTPEAELRPPYPSAKLQTEEEAVLRLRLTIDERGRVVAVEPVGRTDRVFLDAARRHLIAHWRYQPAMEDGRAVASTTTITLHFRLDA
jgi:protein TonB